MEYNVMIQSCIEDCGIPQNEIIKTLVIQEMVWPEYQEVRCFSSEGKVYSAIYKLGERDSKFVEVKKPEGK